MSYSPVLSIVIPVCHGEQFLREALASLANATQPEGGMEILVATRPGHASDETSVQHAAAAAPFPIRVVSIPDGNRANRLNAACAASRGEILAFGDDDCVFPPDWPTRLVARLTDDDAIDLLGGVDELCGTMAAFDVALDTVLHAFIGTGGCRETNGARVGTWYPKLWNMAARRDALRGVSITANDLQPFTPDLLVHEDIDMAHRIKTKGGDSYRTDRFWVSHYRDTSYRSFLRRNYRMAATCRRIGTHRSAHGLLIVGLLAALITAGLAAHFREARPTFLVGLTAYGALSLVPSVRSGIRARALAAAMWVPLLIVGVHLARAAGYLWGKLEGGAK